MSITAERKAEVIKTHARGEARHRQRRSPGGDPVRTDRQPDRALQDPQEGQPLAPGPAEDGLRSAVAPRPPEEVRRGALSGARSRSWACAAKRRTRTRFRGAGQVRASFCRPLLRDRPGDRCGATRGPIAGPYIRRGFTEILNPPVQLERISERPTSTLSAPAGNTPAG